jgi:hypothetical protein
MSARWPSRFRFREAASKEQPHSEHAHRAMRNGSTQPGPGRQRGHVVRSLKGDEKQYAPV